MPTDEGKPPRDVEGPESGESTTVSSFELLDRAKAGDRQALDDLLSRYLPQLRRWATGRLPHWARDAVDTDDLVQDVLVRAFRQLGRFEPRRDGALRAYLRQAVLNRIRDEHRKFGRRPPTVEVSHDVSDQGASPLEEAIGAETLHRYERALQKLRATDREAVIVRVELGCSYEEAAYALEKPSADAARVAIGRALVRLAEEMSRGT